MPACHLNIDGFKLNTTWWWHINIGRDSQIRSAKHLMPPEWWEIKQLISSGAVDASEYPNLD
jgi:hypothetical protein